MTDGRIAELYEALEWVKPRARAYLREALDEVRRLKIELRVRTFNYGFPSRPADHRGSGRSSAFDAGYEAAWRGRAYDNCYTRSDCVRSYNAGFKQGTAEVEAELAREAPSTGGSDDRI